MKNTKIMAVLVVLLAAMLFVGAASAATTVFVHQNMTEDLGIPGLAEGTPVTVYKLSGDTEPVILDQFNLTFGERILASQVGDNTGAWYTSTDKKTENLVNIYYPEIILSAELAPNGVTAGDSIDGKVINTETEIQFIIDAPRVGPAYSEPKGFEPNASILFTTPAGGKTYIFGTETGFILNTEKNPVKLDKVQVNTTTVKAGGSAEAGIWTAQAEFADPIEFKNYAEKSNTISFTLRSTTLTITAAQDSVIRSNPFTVTISGKSQAVYNVSIHNANLDEENPSLQEGQNGYQKDTYMNDKKGNHIAGNFKTDASGQRIIQFNTDGDTKDKSYTIRVTGYTADEKLDNSNYDEVKVKVEKGAVTISASGDGSYYLGQEITLSGTNTDSSWVYLFITGPNLKYTDGIILKTLASDGSQKAAYTATTSQAVSVETDKTWEYKFDTSKVALDDGAYTIYATSVLTNGKSSGENDEFDAVKLSDSEYATVSINLKKPFLSAVPSGTIVAKGDKITLSGIAEGDPNYLQYYIFGPNFYDTGSITVEDDGTYEEEIDVEASWASNQYYVVIEHPMENGKIDVHDTGSSGSGPRVLYIENAAGEGNQSSFVVEGTGKLQSANAANALTTMIDSANIDDVYTKLTFTVVEPRIDVTNPGDQGVGSTFTISGTTNLAVGDQILVEVVSSSFNAVDKSQSSATSGVSQTTKVVAGEGTDNVWSVEVDTTNWKLDEYTIKASGIEVDVTATTNFNLVEKTVTPTATATATTTANSGLRRIRCTRRTWCSSTARPPPQLSSVK